MPALVGIRSVTGPPPNARLNGNSWQVRGLLCAFPFSSPRALDLVTGLSLKPLAGTVYKSTPYGLALDATVAGAGFLGTIPTPWNQLRNAFTLVVWSIASGGTPTANAELFGVSYDNAATSPFVQYGIGFDNSSKMRLEMNDGGSFGSNSATYTPTTGKLTCYVYRCASGLQEELFADGVLIANLNNAISGMIGAATAQVCIGAYPTVSRQTSMYILDARIYNRYWSTPEVQIGSQPQAGFDLYWQPSNRAYSFMSSQQAAFDATQFPHIPMDQPYLVPTRMVPSGRVS